jgi:arylsulfatase A-like enzyme
MKKELTDIIPFARELLFCLLILFSLLSCNSVEQKETGTRQPNIIFIMADDLGYGDLGAYGQKLIQTPNIDQLAKEGMRFTQCYSGSSVCAPARSVLMTGMHAGHTRVRGNFGIGGVKGLAGIDGRVPLKEEDITIAEILQNAGYKTAMVGKWGLGEPNTAGEPNKQGFDEFYGFLNQRRAHSYYPEFIWENQEKILLNNSDSIKNDYTHDLFAGKAIDFIKRNQNDPFFLYIPFCIPHNNYEVPDLGIYEDKPWEPDAKAYAAMISRMDAGVGRIMNTLKEIGMDDNTIVFFTSDNGAAESSQLWKIFESNAPLRGVKRDPYEGGIRVPMIARYPGKVPADVKNELPWYFADVLPTLAEIANAAHTVEVDGKSIVASLYGGEQNLEPRYMYWEFYEKDGWRATRFGDWKAIQHDMHKQKHKAIELYDLRNDLAESINLASEHPEIVQKAEEIFEDAHHPSEHYVWEYLKE